MSNPTDATVLKHFSSLKDPRVERTRRHSLQDILVISLCGFICGVDDWVELEAFGKAKLPWFRTFLELPNGIPSHDTFSRVFAKLDPAALLVCLQLWLTELREKLGGNQVAIDGKTLRGSRSKTLGPLHPVSAWATAAHPSMGQVAVADKSNEITAIPRLLDLLDLKGAFVGIDAMGCQKKIAAQIVGGGGDYVLTVKENQEHLLEDIQACLGRALDADSVGYEHDS